jgi:hypothetical protein
MKSGLWQPGKLQVVTWRGTAKCSAAWKEALDEKTVAIDDIDDDGNTLLHMAAGQGQSLKKSRIGPFFCPGVAPPRRQPPGGKLWRQDML